MTATLAILGALLFGTSDFIGGWLARRSSVFRVAFGEQVASLLAFTLLAVVVPAPQVTTADLIAGTVAGLGVIVGLIALYAAFTHGPISAVAPIAAVVGAVLSVAGGLAQGDSAGPLFVVGSVAALGGIVLVTQGDTSGTSAGVSRKAIGLAVLAGVAFAAFFLGLAQTSSDAGLWPLVAARTAALPVVTVLVWVKTGGFFVSRRDLRLNIAGGLIGSAAAVLIIVALQRGPVVQAVVLGSLYPVSTVVLAWLIVRERLRPVQWGGVALILAGIPMISAS